MAQAPDDVQRSLAFAEIALGQIKALKQPASPRNYEVWYTYATSYNAELNQSINETLRRAGTVSDADLTQIYDQYLSPSRLSDRIDEVGSKVLEEIGQVASYIETATGSASQYGQSLAGATKQLSSTRNAEQLKSIVENLVRSSREMEDANRKLEERLSASRSEIKQLQENLETIRAESLTDALTSLPNRKYFDQAISKAITEATAARQPLALLAMDIDHFKRFNDTYGHLTGDQVLRLVGLAVRQNVKGQDVPARYGGEEFLVLLPNTGLSQAVTLAEHIRRAVMVKELMKRSTGEHLGRITVSIGVSLWRDDESVQSFIERADACLYAAKRGGRNRVVSETDPEMKTDAKRVA